MTGALLLRQVLFLHSVIVHSQPHQNVYYVKTLGSQCPTNIAYTECKTLGWYYENMSNWSKRDTKLLFQEGIHSLDGFLMVNWCENLTMSGVGNASQSDNGLPKSATKINCAPNSSLYFSKSTGIYVNNLYFESCGGLFHFGRKHRVQISAALAFVSVQDVNISQVVINNSRGYGLFTFNIEGKNLVQNSAFLHIQTSLRVGMPKFHSKIIYMKQTCC